VLLKAGRCIIVLKDTGVSVFIFICIYTGVGLLLVKLSSQHLNLIFFSLALSAGVDNSSKFTKLKCSSSQFTSYYAPESKNYCKNHKNCVCGSAPDPVKTSTTALAILPPYDGILATPLVVCSMSNQAPAVRRLEQHSGASIPHGTMAQNFPREKI
jgi:hypothetical protein